MKNELLLPVILTIFVAFSAGKAQTIVSIKGDQFLINDKLTYSGRYWKGNKIGSSAKSVGDFGFGKVTKLMV